MEEMPVLIKRVLCYKTANQINVIIYYAPG